MKYADPKRSYRTRKDRMRLHNSSMYRTLEFDARAYDVDSDVIDIVKNNECRINMRRVGVTKNRM